MTKDGVSEVLTFQDYLSVDLSILGSEIERGSPQ
jgi:hypothetical protein